MKIQEINSNKITAGYTKDDISSRTSALKFEDVFDSEISKVNDSIINKMLNEIDDAAEKLKENLNLDNLLIYKKKVKEFLQSSINGMFQRNKRESISLNGRKKIYTIVDKVNEKLEMMTKEFIEGNKKNIDLLSAIEEIRGLLVDIYS
ncbi:YaaR family protein [Thermoanaerobacterium sp. CMT5567-10]|uniref:YaaR family protein n=1 Tax=Thermoanaerobacterium sp. CMT5567-10 TaxID=3061989 RepID=UPI0026E11061|nr:YaaR family protein [Thermoanaerobacterium sp. CMT5567-10]WKV07672.1 YaaR family protein [Thermoanaerobacterium sp. CMT5567-10]